jgi:iron complex outermembrane recepter protein
MCLSLSAFSATVRAGGAPADNPASSRTGSSEELTEIVITGSLIPQASKETAQPITVITSEDLRAKGFATVAEALQHTSFATGAIQNPQETNSFTPGAQLVSFFGLSASYTKFLIDGRPMADYPALYNGTDIVTSITGIPTVLVDSIDILPGGQSSIYGSDAIAGVVNIHLRHKLEGPIADLRYGWTKGGGGTERRLAVADGINFHGVDFVFGGQYERVDPIWGYQRRLTDQYFADGSSPQTAERDWVVTGLFGQPNGDFNYMLDPASCANVRSQFGNSVALRTRSGQYCGTVRDGLGTSNNGIEATQGFLRLSDDIADNLQLFTEVLLDHEVTRFNNGTVIFDTQGDNSGPYNYYSDPSVQGGADLLNLYHIFSPEEAGHLGAQNNKNTTNSIRATIGAQGSIAASDWKYLADMTFTENKLTEATYLAFTDAINAFYAPIFGANLGPDPNFGQPQYTVDYASFFKPISPAQYRSFTGYAYAHSHTEESLARGELTKANLLQLPGGDAGIALLVEGGGQGWRYAPDPGFLNGETYLYTSTAGAGHRSRYAGTIEVRLPILPILTIDASNRFDDYRVAGDSVHKDTFNVGLEFRPVPTLLIRGRLGTAFKAPTLSDEFQGASGFFTSVTDYYSCAQLGYTVAGGNLGDCPYAGTQVLGKTSGNLRLQPITAKVAGAGIAWTPVSELQVSVDYLHWRIRNEVAQQNADQLLRLDSNCLLGELDINSPTCVDAIAQINRDASGRITQINIPKINVSEERLGVVTGNLGYTWVTKGFGNLSLAGSYSNVVKHSFVKFAGDTEIDLLNNPFFSTEFRTKANATLSWDYRGFGISIYAERYGRTPNYLAQVEGYGQEGAGRLPTWTVANLSAKYEILPGLVISGNIVNLTDKLPPIDHTVPGIYVGPYNYQNYNNYGRSYFAELSYRLAEK